MSTIRYTNTDVPQTPATGTTRVFVDQSDKHLKQIDDEGNVIDLTSTSDPLTLIPNSGVVGLDPKNVEKIDNNTIRIPAMDFFVDDTNTTTSVTNPIDVTISGDGLYSSGTGYISITAYQPGDVSQTPAPGNNNVGIKVVGTEVTIIWTREIPLERGFMLPPDDRSGVTLTRIFFIGSTLLLIDRPWYTADKQDASLDILLASPGYAHEVEFVPGGTGTVFDMTRDAVSVRRGAAAIGHDSIRTYATDDVFLGLYIDAAKVTRGAPIRFHLFNLTDASGTSDEYIQNVDVTAGGAYEQWWRFYDDTANQAPGPTLTPSSLATNQWSYISFGYFAGIGNIIGVWGVTPIADGDVNLAQLSLPTLRLNNRTKDITMLFTLLIKATATNPLGTADAILLPPPKINLGQ